MSIILASTSPRRRELLALLGIAFEIVPPTFEEIPSPDLSPREQAKQFALDKARSIARRHPDDLVLGSDTVIEIDGTLVGKPQDLDDAETMLRQLRGRTHQVHTGIALIHEAAYVTVVRVETALVRMTAFTDQELRRYLETEESLGKAGAYSIQGEGARFIEKIEGDYPTIVGLPLRQTANLLEQRGVMLPTPVEEIYRRKPYANWKAFR
ncbi:MAG: Maf family protein [Nitrospira sp.]|nr:Maf family protein [Nitrospira sp.]MDE0487231.1 Maf family protein [Nitrospira sp.]